MQFHGYAQSTMFIVLIVMLFLSPQFRVDKPRRILHCTAPSQEEAQQQLEVVRLLLAEPDYSYVSMELPPDKKKYLDLKQMEFLDDVMHRCDVNVSYYDNVYQGGHALY